MRGRTRRIRASTTTRWGLRRLDTFEVLPRAGEYRCSTLRRCQAPGAGGRETLSCRPPRGAATGRRSCCRTPLSDATGRRRCDHDDVPDKNRRQACWRASGRIGEHPLHVNYTEENLQDYIDPNNDTLMFRLADRHLLAECCIMLGMDKRATITTNWPEFRRRANIREGDICAFRFRITSKRSLVLTVHCL
ncbi:uncharacterized protein LOC119354221 isoform X2 [Triticum dicoccoides]|uniref:uncharacterized protein LOC119354221 isoform X2 n=1 Tax=Triticum dicoccoides TaxID=85692 RepID=UPI001890B5DE|nr:uncharacterized protein LOC119354221 isoform X2 [Triticum dicoccoides]